MGLVYLSYGIPCLGENLSISGVLQIPIVLYDDVHIYYIGYEPFSSFIALPLSSW